MSGRPGIDDLIRESHLLSEQLLATAERVDRFSRELQREVDELRRSVAGEKVGEAGRDRDE